MRRSILLLPKFANMHLIDQLRERYDPLAKCVSPHITLVFPFESEIATETLRNHILATLHGVKPFSLRLQGVTGTPEGYLFLGVKRGNDQIIEIHDRLYSGILAPFLYRKVSYIPHITVGKVSSREEFEAALALTREMDEVFETLVSEVYIEIIGENEESLIEFSVMLG